MKHTASAPKEILLGANAPFAVDTITMLVVALGVTRACNHKEPSAPMLKQLAALSESLGKVQHLWASTGFYSATIAGACEARGIEPLNAVRRDQHHPAPQERITEPAALLAKATQRNACPGHGAQTENIGGRALYASCVLRQMRQSAPTNWSLQ